MKEKITLQRTGNRPLSFLGELVAETTTQTSSGPGESRWWEIALYHADNKKLILSIGYRTRWQSERARDDVIVVESAEEMTDMVRAHDWATGIYGYDRHPEKQERLMRTLGACWAEGMTEVLREIGPEELS